MSIENPHFLEKEIHRTFNWDVDTANSFKSQISSLLSSYPITQSQNFHMFVHVVQEFNKKAYTFGLISSIIGPTDAGFRPLSLNDLLGDFLLLENGSFMLQEDGSKLIPDVETALYLRPDGSVYFQPDGVSLYNSPAV